MSTVPDLAEHMELAAEAQDLLFREARTANSFSDEPVSDDQLRSIYELAKWGPTSANTQPLRVVYVKSREAKSRLVALMSEGNQVKTASAPVAAILAADIDFHENIPKLFPMRPQMKDNFSDQAGREVFARFNAAIQTGYFIVSVRAAGLAAGPMAGFDAAGVDAEFFAGTALRSILVVNIGHPGIDPWFGRLPRLEFEEATSIV